MLKAQSAALREARRLQQLEHDLQAAIYKLSRVLRPLGVRGGGEI